jgi:hypothetical protein
MQTKGEGIFLSASIQKAGHELLDHQCWVMGRDVLSAEGNLLCEFGFSQVRCPNGGLTQYELNHALNEGIFLGRKDFRPRRTSGKVELHSREYPDFAEGISRLELFLQGLAWFADYEKWIAWRMPTQYREECLATFPRRALPGSEIAERWSELANRIAGGHEASNVTTNNVHPESSVALGSSVHQSAHDS